MGSTDTRKYTAAQKTPTVVALQQLDHRRLSGSGLADEGHARARGDGQVEAWVGRIRGAGRKGGGKRSSARVGGFSQQKERGGPRAAQLLSGRDA